MRRMIFLFTVMLISAACTGNKTRKILQDVENYIEQRPDSALAVLQKIDPQNLDSSKDKAFYSLMLSMALDKNYIDLTNDSIIAPAVSYYSKYGKPEYRMKTFYYKGRIAKNAGDYDEALNNYIIAEKWVAKTNDNIAIGRLYKAIFKVYQYCFDTEAMIKASKKASEYYLAGRDTSKYLGSVNDIITGYLMSQDTLNSRNYLNIFKNCWEILSPSQKGTYYAGLLHLNEFNDINVFYNILQKYYSTVPNPRQINWLSIADAGCSLKEYETAHYALEQHIRYSGEETSGYYWLNGIANEALQNDHTAMLSFKKCLELNNTRNGYLFGSDVRFIEERHQSEISLQRKNYMIVITTLCCILAGLVILIIAFSISKLRKAHKAKVKAIEAEKSRYKDMYSDTLQEIDRLGDALKDASIDSEVKARISERLDILNGFIAANISDSYSKTAAEKLDSFMKDRNSFIESTRLSFLIAHPDFIRYLKDKKLSDREIGLCCLYAMGLRGKDISNYMGTSGQYKFSGSLRKKLGLGEHDTNIDIFLRNLLKDSSSSF